MALYTKKGDEGDTFLCDGSKTSKADARVSAYGDVDETNAAIGIATSVCDDARLLDTLGRIQSDLFRLGNELAMPNGSRAVAPIDAQRIAQLEEWIDEAEAETSALTNFILPGGSPTAAALHLARTVCRRAERNVVALAKGQDISPNVLVYLNRLSDLLFALSRLANHRAGIADVVWTAPKS